MTNEERVALLVKEQGFIILVSPLGDVYQTGDPVFQVNGSLGGLLPMIFVISGKATYEEAEKQNKILEKHSDETYKMCWGPNYCFYKLEPEKAEEHGNIKP